MASALRACLAFVAVMALASAASGQSVISTRSGVIYYFDGSVSLNDQPLQPDPGRFPNMPEGSELRTARGQAEVLLTPGVFLRIGENSSMRMIESDLANTRVELESGSAIVDSGDPASGTSVTLVFRDWQIQSAHEGTYRVDADPPRLWVTRGDAEVSSVNGGEGVKVAEGMDLPFASTLQAEKFTAAPHDNLSDWAKGRDDSIVADDSITEQIDNGPLSQMAPDGFDYFPPLGVLTLAYASPYGPILPIQPGFYSMYLPGSVYFPMMILPLRAARSFPGRLAPIRIGSPFIPPGMAGVGAGRVPVIVGGPRPINPVGPRPVNPVGSRPMGPIGPHPVAPIVSGAPVGSHPVGPVGTAGPHVGSMPSHPISHPVTAPRAGGAAHR